MISNDELYQRWLDQRRGEQPRGDLTDRVMAAVTQADVGQSTSRLAIALTWIDRSRPRRLAACTGALLVGSMPFLYVAYMAQAFIF